jgi:glycosyltransferase involved in cell wall biosynthesis
MKKKVHIKISDQGWILEKLAKEITNRLPYVSYGVEPDASAEIQYYITYGCRGERVSPIEIAFFTHKEEDAGAAAKFDFVASEVDFCVAQSPKTESLIRSVEPDRKQTISPGVDLDAFTPRVRIGVVGRTYHTGRKGEALVAEVIDLPGIEWHFTGKGWPGPAEFVPDAELPEFYRSMDYILVPALNEGGPMCVLEALASGCKVIAPAVGWVPEFPHIEFTTGDANDLRRVLMDVVEEKFALRRSVEKYSWQAWAEQHHQLFCQLLGYNPLNSSKESSELNQITQNSLTTAVSEALRVSVIVHGKEMSSSLGGPSVRAPRTVEALRGIGVNASFVAGRNFKAEKSDVVHALNVWHPDECAALLQQVEKYHCTTVFSPIFLDLSEYSFYNQKLLNVLSQCESLNEAKNALTAFTHENDQYLTMPLQQREPFPHYYSTIRRLVSFSHHLIFLSKHEEALLRQIGINHPSTSIVKNPVNSAVFSHGDPALFRHHIGVDDYVLCVGRIESRKNQALLALALSEENIPLVLVGHESDSNYANLIRKWGGNNVIFAGRIEANSPMLASAYAGAKVFCLPSWSEGAPLVALEAASAGCNMVLSNRSSEKEYFGDLARYVNPADIDDIRKKVVAAWSDSTDTRALQVCKLQSLMTEFHSWEIYANKTKDAYFQAVRHVADKNENKQPDNKRNIYVDLTTTAHHKATPTGIARVESCLSEELHEIYGSEVQYIIWNSYYQKFIKINYTDFLNGSVKGFSTEPLPGVEQGVVSSNINFCPDDIIVVFGGAWIRNSNYLRTLHSIKKLYRVAIVTTIYDVIQHKLQYLFPEGVGLEFSVNCKNIISISDHVLTCSEQSRLDIIDFCLETQTPLCPVSIFRLGDEAVHTDYATNIELASEGLTGLEPGDKFVLFVSTIDIRKNHSLLLMLWKGLIDEYGAAVPKLVLVGNLGWRGEEAINLLKRTPILHHKVLLLHGVKDSSLDWLYKNCLFTVFPSYYEGWGLPVAESCRYGKFCLASNAGSLPEVAPGHAEYIDPLDCIGWYKALQKYCFDREALAEKNRLAAHYQPTDWHQTAGQVVQALETVQASIRLPVLKVGDVINFTLENRADQILVEEYALNGWYFTEITGTWTAGNKSYIGFEYYHDSDLPLAFSLLAFGYTPSNENISVQVLVNNQLVAIWSVGADAKQHEALLPAALLNANKDFIVELIIENPKSPTEFSSLDHRSLGLHVASASLVQYKESEIVEDIAENVAAITENSMASGIVYRMKRKLHSLKNKHFPHH